MLFTLVTKGKLNIDTAAEEAGVIYQNVNSKNPLTIVFGIADFLCQKVSHPAVIVLRYCIGTA